MVTGLAGLELLLKVAGLQNRSQELRKEQKELENKPMVTLTLGEAKKGMERIDKIDEELIGIYIQLELMKIVL
jgi:hypothetical protein